MNVQKILSADFHTVEQLLIAVL